MIEGIKVDIDCEELREHLFERATYHRERADWYASQIDALREGGLKPTAITNDPISGLEHSEQKHLGRAGYFRFLAEHLVAGETYRLNETDLTRVDLLSKYL